MTAQRLLLAGVLVITALLLQSTVMTRLPLPGAAPDLLLVLVVAYALADGPLAGMGVGFSAGLLADALSDHELGRLALAYVLVGVVAGALQDDTERSATFPFVAVAVGAVVGILVFAGMGILLGDLRVTAGAVLRSLASSVAYDVALTPFVVPVVAALIRRVDVDPLRR
ncbi:MAG TPA: rod shape-determining protein MreD [Mycobacteriales bacterium]|nr:rod shape-determining protein MreD [Mycobacteriales bacterium]